MECPAEVIIEPRKFGGYTWAICQPDAHWGEYCSGVADTLEMAKSDACWRLKKIHREQGYA